MPFMTFNVSVEEAIRNAGRLIKEGGAEAVKLEGGEEVKHVVKALVDAGIPVMGHAGLTPQRIAMFGGYRVRGKSVAIAKKLIKDAKALDEAGVFSIVLELMTAEVAKVITEEVSVPTIGIGAGPYCDGQVLVFHDMLGLFERFTPRFVKKYANLGEIILKAVQEYVKEVKSGEFPSKEHSFHMKKEKYEKLLDVLGRKEEAKET
jgi:3-methyl-2-oxobutanoate hydroxymethyltransferase